jgi:hypothetical protein
VSASKALKTIARRTPSATPTTAMSLTARALDMESGGGVGVICEDGFGVEGVAADGVAGEDGGVGSSDSVLTAEDLDQDVASRNATCELPPRRLSKIHLVVPPILSNDAGSV